MKNIEIGDKVTYKYLDTNKQFTMIVVTDSDINDLNTMKKEDLIQILKIERPKYEVIEEKKEELLTGEEKEFLKKYIKLIESLNNGNVESIRKEYYLIVIRLKTQLEYQVEVGPKFKNLEDSKLYTLKELEVQ